MADKTGRKKVSGAGGKVLGFIIATVVWGVAVCYLVIETYSPTPSTGCNSSIPCLALNEWGDFLAGVFAPIAFLWLVATVWIQSDELRLQREEMVASRGVLDAQAKEAKQQATYLGEQTALLREEATQRRSDNAYSQFIALLQGFVQTSSNVRNDVHFTVGGRTFWAFPGGSRDTLEYLRNLYEQLSRIRNDVINNGIDISHVNELISLFHYIYAAEELLEEIPFAQRLMWKSNKLPEIVSWYCDLIKVSSQLSPLLGHVDARKKRLASARALN